jgi:ABC-type sugar transport system permease subunit
MTKDRLKKSLVSYGFLSPFLVVFLVFLAYPVVYSFWISLHKTTIYTSWYDPFGDMKYVGFENYITLLWDMEFWWALFLTFIYGILTIPTGIMLSLLLAVLLNNQIRFKSFFRSAYFLPNVLDLLVIGVIWILIFSPYYGLIDMLLSKIGIGTIKDGILGNPWTCLPAIAFAMVLKGAGFGMILFLTAIQNIPQSVYEAADIDGANWFQKLKFVTIPLVKPIILFMAITGTIACLTAFTEVYAMTTNTGGPTIQVAGSALKSANLAGYHLYRNFSEGYYGQAAAFSFLLLGIALTISFINMKILKSEQ